MTKERPLVAIDLFSGGGGLSLGLQHAGFNVSAAVEIDPIACETFSYNHPSTVLYQSDIANITGSQLQKTSPTGEIDLIAGCPPCQGFSSLTNKYKREDPRNLLIFEYVRIIKEIRPRVIMMENVPGLALKGKPLLDAALRRLRCYGYKLSFETLNAADYGVPQQRRRFVLLGSLTGRIKIPRPTHGIGTQNPWTTVRAAIELNDAPITMNESFSRGGPELFNWNIVRDITPVTRARLAATREGDDRYVLPSALRPNCHVGSESGFSNVYGRLEWDKPAPTITGGCTTLSKGRFGHPSLPRTISVREAATLQSFPETYALRSRFMDKVCQVVGNALPPKFAKAMALACRSHLEIQ